MRPWRRESHRLTSGVPVPMVPIRRCMMRLDVAYHRRSEIAQGATGVAIALSPNLRRDRVSFRGTLKNPLRFREAISTLHDVVISDLRFHRRDPSAYQAWLAEQAQREAAIRQAAAQAKKAELSAQAGQPVRPGLESDYRRLRSQYWNARQQYSNYLARHDPELWRLLMPCDPVVTVAPDVLFFECFSKDESSYGCLTVSRESFSEAGDVALGTTNVDYSWSLYEHFQTLRSYRQTRFEIDPSGFEVQTQSEGHREEQIDLPPGWLRGFMQMQSTMSLPLKRVPVSREALYSVIAFLKRHKAARSPRAVRFELIPGRELALVLEPWEQRIELPGSTWSASKEEIIRVWGRDRLRVLARLLPLIEHVDVYLIGTGLPCFWVAHMGDMRLVLGLSGWTTNDWTAASALDQISPPATINELMLEEIAGGFRAAPALSFSQLCQQIPLPPATIAAGLNRLALLGQVIHDLPAGVYRWRQVMPVPLTNAQIGPENLETVEARKLTGKTSLQRDEQTAAGMRLLTGRAPGHSVELLIDGDGRIIRGKCSCSHHFKSGLRKGPCRHLQALRNAAFKSQPPATLDRWFNALWT